MFFYLSLKQDDDWGNIKIKNVSIMLRTLIIMQLHNLPKYIPNAFFFHIYIQLFQHHLLKILSFSHWLVLQSFLKINYRSIFGFLFH